MHNSFSQRAVSFFSSIDLLLPPSLRIEVMNPYKNPETLKCVRNFFTKYFNDERRRIFIFGINPGRFGGGLTGISFTDPVALREKCGIENSLGSRKELSSEFVYSVIDAFGGPERFYRHFFISAICPLGFVKGATNYNYYDDMQLLKAATPFIRKTWKQQFDIGAKSDVVIVVGAGKNARFIEQLNEETGYFRKIISLDHPRYIMQYRRKEVHRYVNRYLDAFQACIK
jgi:hypothetical protein